MDICPSFEWMSLQSMDENNTAGVLGGLEGHEALTAGMTHSTMGSHSSGSYTIDAPVLEDPASAIFAKYSQLNWSVLDGSAVRLGLFEMLTMI